MTRRSLGLFCYAVGIAIPIAGAALAKWYLGMWGFGYRFDVIGWLVILLMTFPAWGLAFTIGSRLRRNPPSRPRSE